VEEKIKNLAVVVGPAEAVKVYSFKTIEQASQFKTKTKVPTGGIILVTRGEDGLKHVAASFLVDLYNATNPGTKIKKFERKDLAVRRTYAALSQVAEETIMAEVKAAEKGKGEKAEKAPKVVKPPKEKKESYHDKIRVHFRTHTTATVEEIMKLTGADERNAKVAMGIICNPKRVKNAMAFDYDRPTKTYTLKDSGEPAPAAGAGPKAAAA
jgi:hypothetical protein